MAHAGSESRCSDLQCQKGLRTCFKGLARFFCGIVQLQPAVCIGYEVKTVIAAHHVCKLASFLSVKMHCVPQGSCDREMYSREHVEWRTQPTSAISAQRVVYVKVEAPWWQVDITPRPCIK